MLTHHPRSPRPVTQGEKAEDLVQRWLAWKPDTVTVGPDTVEEVTREAITLLVTGYSARTLSWALVSLTFDKPEVFSGRPYRVPLTEAAYRWHCGTGIREKQWRARVEAQAIARKPSLAAAVLAADPMHNVAQEAAWDAQEAFLRRLVAIATEPQTLPHEVAQALVEASRDLLAKGTAEPALITGLSIVARRDDLTDLPPEGLAEVLAEAVEPWDLMLTAFGGDDQ